MSAAAKRRGPVDVAEVKKLDAYLSKLFGNPHIRVVPKKGDTAEVFIGEDDLGELTVDDEDGDRSLQFQDGHPGQQAIRAFSRCRR